METHARGIRRDLPHGHRARLCHTSYPDISSDAHSRYDLARIRPPDDDIDRSLGQWSEKSHVYQDRDLEHLPTRLTPRNGIFTLNIEIILPLEYSDLQNPEIVYNHTMITATHTSSGRIEKKIESTYIKMEELYAYARILKSEFDLTNGRYSTHTSAKSLIHELDN